MPVPFQQVIQQLLQPRQSMGIAPCKPVVKSPEKTIFGFFDITIILGKTLVTGMVGYLFGKSLNEGIKNLTNYNNF